MLWAPDWKIADTWSYAMSVTVPWLSMDVEADITSSSFPGFPNVRRSDKERGWGDIVAMPLMLSLRKQFVPRLPVNMTNKDRG